MSRKDRVTPKEGDYIESLAKRYTIDPQAERSLFGGAYADAMGNLHAKYPDDLDAATLYAAALMNIRVIFFREDLKLGNIMDMTWGQALAAPQYKDFGIRKSCCNPACMACDCPDLCMGDCLKHRFYRSPEARNISWLCNSWQQIIRHTRDQLQDIADGIRGRQIRAD